MNNDVSQTPGGSGPNPPPPPGGSYQPPFAPPPRQRGSRLWIIPVVLGGVLVLVVLMIGVGLLLQGLPGFAELSYGRHIALIRVDGVITAGRSTSGLFSGSYCGSEDLIEQLERARKNKDVGAVVLRIDSPGGSPAGAEEVYKEIMRVRKTKPVYSSMADVAASGAYYIASASDRIYADSSTLTGSIGVIWDVADMSGLYKKIGFNPQVIKSGKFKDIGSPNRPLTPEERALLQAIVMETYGQFVNAVAEGRKLPVAEVKKIADGRVLTGTQAVKAKLVDRIGGMRDTIKAAALAAGIKGEPRVVEYKKRRSIYDIFGTEADRAASEAERALGKQLIDQLLDNKGRTPGLR